MNNKLFIYFSLWMCGFISSFFCQTINGQMKIVSKAPVSFRVNVSGNNLHGYYKKNYNLEIYGDSFLLGYRADCDADDDWSGAVVKGTTQDKNVFEVKFKCKFNPHILYGTVLPGNSKGLNHYDGLNKQGVNAGDLTMTYKLDSKNKPIDSIIGVVFDRGPQNQPGESSVATCKKFKSSLDNNQFIYLTFPNSAKYLLQIIGLKSDKKTLNRDPTNSDFKQAYENMLKKNSKVINTNKKNLINKLSKFSIIKNFDNATKEEKAEGKLKPKNNDRNLNN